MEGGSVDSQSNAVLKPLMTGMSEEPCYTHDQLLSSPIRHGGTATNMDNYSDGQDAYEDVFVSNECRAAVTSDDELLQNSSVCKPLPIKAASTFRRRSSNRPLLQRQKSLSFANPPAVDGEQPCTNSPAVIEELPNNNGEVNSEPMLQSSTPATHMPKMPPHIRPKLSRERTKTGNIVLPHKFRKRDCTHIFGSENV